MKFVRIVTIAYMLAIGGCSNSEFAGSGAAKKNSATEKPAKETEEKPEVDEGKDVTDPKNGADEGTDTSTDVKEEADDKPSDLEEQDGEVVAPINYDSCKALPSAGKRAYGKCNAGEAVVIVNDGHAQEMTCCPLKGKNIFSLKAEELFVQRTGLCQANEVLTGMVDATTPTIVCSKINTKYLELTTPVPSQYVVGKAPGIMGQISASYNVSDTCICPEKTLAIGGHTGSDNKCAEQCVTIRKKK